MKRYEGPPDYEDVPLCFTEAELARGAGSDFPRLLAERMRGQGGPPIDGVEYGVPATAESGMKVGFGDPRHNYGELDVPGAENLRPYPDGSEGCNNESVPQRIPCYPHEQVRQRGLRIFSLWGDNTGGTAENLIRRETPSRWMVYRLIESPIVPDCGSQLWSVDIWGYERRRFVTDGTVTPLTPGVITQIGGAAPVDDPGNAASMLKVRIMWAAASGGETRILDVGEGIRLALEACLLTVEILYPFPSTITFNGTTEPELGPGLVLDSEIGAQVVPTVSTPGQQLATNTMVVQVLAGQTDVPILIPPGTRRLGLIQTADGTAMVPRWDNSRDPVNPGSSLGEISLGGARRVEGLTRPGNAGSIRTGPADPDFDRWLTAIFELEI